MKHGTGAAVAAFAILAGSALPSPAARAEDAILDNRAVSANRTERLHQDLEARLRKDAAAIAAGAMRAATALDLTFELDLDKRPAGPTSVLLVGEL
jgi:hypothetical protein